MSQSLFLGKTSVNMKAIISGLHCCIYVSSSWILDWVRQSQFVYKTFKLDSSFFFPLSIFTVFTLLKIKLWSYELFEFPVAPKPEPPWLEPPSTVTSPVIVDYSYSDLMFVSVKSARVESLKAFKYVMFPNIGLGGCWSILMAVDSTKLILGNWFVARFWPMSVSETNWCTL